MASAGAHHSPGARAEFVHPFPSISSHIIVGRGTAAGRRDGKDPRRILRYRISQEKTLIWMGAKDTMKPDTATAS